MFTWLSVFKSSLDFTKQRSTQPEADRKKRETATAQLVAQAEQDFLAAIAELPPEERDKQLQMHRWYASLAQRQGIAEAEWRMDQYRQTGDERYKF